MPNDSCFSPVCTLQTADIYLRGRQGEYTKHSLNGYNFLAKIFLVRFWPIPTPPDHYFVWYQYQLHPIIIQFYIVWYQYQLHPIIIQFYIVWYQYQPHPIIISEVMAVLIYRKEKKSLKKLSPIIILSSAKGKRTNKCKENK